MFTKLEQRSWIKIEVARARSTQECFHGLRGTLGGMNSIILHDSGRSHTAAAVMDLLCRWQWEILEHPPYSTDISP